MRQRAKFWTWRSLCSAGRMVQLAVMAGVLFIFVLAAAELGPQAHRCRSRAQHPHHHAGRAREMILADEYFQDSIVNYGFKPNAVDYERCDDLLTRVNALFEALGYPCELRSGHRTREKTLALIASGHRATLGGNHELSLAVDVADPTNMADADLSDELLAAVRPLARGRSSQRRAGSICNPCRPSRATDVQPVKSTTGGLMNRDQAKQKAKDALKYAEGRRRRGLGEGRDEVPGRHCDRVLRGRARVRPLPARAALPLMYTLLGGVALAVALFFGGWYCGGAVHDLDAAQEPR
jgi:hypothetical protein